MTFVFVVAIILDSIVCHGITSLVASNLMVNGLRDRIPDHYLDRLNRVYTSTLYRNMLLSGELNNILSAFNKHDIPVISLKGTVLAEVLYENPALRATADMDILVHSRQSY